MGEAHLSVGEAILLLRAKPCPWQATVVPVPGVPGWSLNQVGRGRKRKCRPPSQPFSDSVSLAAQTSLCLWEAGGCARACLEKAGWEPWMLLLAGASGHRR